MTLMKESEIQHIQANDNQIRKLQGIFHSRN